MTRFSITAILLLLSLPTSPALAEEMLFNSSAAIKEETTRIGNEAREFLRTTVDTEKNGLIGTVVVAGAATLAYAFDDDIRDKVHSRKSWALDKTAEIGSLLGNPFIHIGIVGAVYGGGIIAKSPRYQETGLMLGEALFLADASTFILKEAIGRERPLVTGDKGRFSPLQFKANSDSLPSMHTASSFAMASVLAANTDSVSTKLLCYSAAAFVGLARIYQDEHWASDVIVGAAIGELSGRIVAIYHQSHGKIAIAPMVAAKGAGLGLVGRW